MDIEIKIPDIGVDVVEVIEILVKVGDTVKKDDSLITVEGKKVSMEVPSTHFGVVKSILVNIGHKVKTGSSIAFLTLLDNFNILNNKQNMCLYDTKFKNKTNFSSREIFKTYRNKTETLVHATPIVRRLARELNVNLDNVIGSGRKGRIIREDIMSYINQVEMIHKDDSYIKCDTKNDMKDFVKYDSHKSSDVAELYLTNIQAQSGKNIFKSWSIVPHVTQFDDADITNLEKFRKIYNSNLDNQNINSKLTALVFVIKVIAKSLKIFPKFNSILCTKIKKKVILKKDVNIGIAVNSKNGLLVPVINNVNNKSLVELSVELTSLSKKVELGTLNISCMSGGGFTISNLGGIGGTGFTPIINYPEVAILGMSKALIKPFWNGTEFVPRLMLPLSLSYDHRVIDGVEAVLFMNYVKKLLSDIRLLLL
ncbi:MAG: 2-oxo acid dehydrogenase subunit E2 [Buchnera aphidicola (Kaburagia rhusicola ensigallis)]